MVDLIAYASSGTLPGRRGHTRALPWSLKAVNIKVRHSGMLLLAIPHKFFLDTGGIGTGLATCESHFMIGTI
jgi:hypothetical protein